jgi:DNA repair protein RecN (Recombination protein N)
MLREIHIKNYAVIDSLTLELHPQLNLLSGETGSGKSILVDALALALGGRASPDIIRTGQDHASITAVFRSEDAAPWARWLDDYGLAGEDGSELILRREIQAGGRSRLLVNDQPVTVAAVKALAPSLVEIHGQNEQVSLLARDAQLDLLDQFAAAEDLLEKVAKLFARRRELEHEKEDLSQNEQDRLRTVDLLSFQVQELERAHLDPGEDARLEEEKRLLANLERIRSSAVDAYSQLYEDQGAVCSRLAAVARAIDELERYVSVVQPYREPLASAQAALEDLAFFLRGYLDKLEANPHRLEEVEDRLALIDRLKRKYGRTIEEITACLERIRSQLAGLGRADARRAEVQQELERVEADYLEKAHALSAERRGAAQKLDKLVRQELAQLGMDKARFQIYFDTAAQRAGGPKGLDEIEFRISPNPGEELRPLEKIASGGELSRLMLALKTVVGRAGAEGRAGAGRRAIPTFVFDEVDAGIGGRVAESVGQRLKRLARDTQVLCVTHLAQIACFADHHYYVEKFERGGRTVTAVTYLESGKQRAAELARMLSGSQITDAVLKHAAAMLKQAAG